MPESTSSSAHDRPCGCNDHDDQHKLRFREVEALDVVNRLMHTALQRSHACKKRGGPQSEDHFRLRQEMEQVLLDRTVWETMGPVRETLHAEGVQHCEGKKRCGEDFDRGGGHG